MIKAILFDIYGTLIDIQSDEHQMGTYELLSKYLEYKHIRLSPDQVKWFYHEEFARRLGDEPARPGSMEDFRKLISANPRAYPDDDIRSVFLAIIGKCGIPGPAELVHGVPECGLITHGGVETCGAAESERASETKNQGRASQEQDLLQHLAVDLSHLFRASTRKRIFLYPTVKPGVRALREKYLLGIVSNAQEAFTPEELDVFGLREYFDPIVLSSQAGVKKPNPRIFQAALDRLGVQPHEAAFVGNELAADVMGAASLGMRTILIGSPSYGIAGVAPDATIPGNDTVEIGRIVDQWNHEQ